MLFIHPWGKVNITSVGNLIDLSRELTVIHTREEALNG
jgi:hypothetical protein